MIELVYFVGGGLIGYILAQIEFFRLVKNGKVKRR